jgi:muramoyltetrapeptide carboxypeptidase LdcA involved in peptidoglycan recycling
MDSCNSSSINSRIADLHNAFLDKHVKFVLAAIGGLNSYELLPYLDFELIKKNPKAFCGYSDITVLQNAILAKT